MREHDLVVAVFGVLYLLHVLHFLLVFDLRSSRQIEVHRAEGGRGDVDVIDMVKHHWLVWVGQGQVLLGLFRHQSFSTMADYLPDQASSGESKEQAHGRAN